MSGSSFVPRCGVSPVLQRALTKVGASHSEFPQRIQVLMLFQVTLPLSLLKRPSRSASALTTRPKRNTPTPRDGLSRSRLQALYSAVWLASILCSSGDGRTRCWFSPSYILLESSVRLFPMAASQQCTLVDSLLALASVPQQSFRLFTSLRYVTNALLLLTRNKLLIHRIRLLHEASEGC
jgi:hypothetical protein